MYKIINETSVKLIPESAIIQLPAAETYGYAYEAWLAAGNTPEPADAKPDSRPPEIAARLRQIDAESVRPLRSKLSGVSTKYDDQKLAELDAEASALREELKGMTKDTGQ